MKTTRILFVEDDPEMIATYKENFLEPEFETLTAENGRQALEMLGKASGYVDVVVTDNYMPEMDGITMLKNIRREYPELTVIIVTGYGNWADYVDAYNLDVIKFLDKPIKMAELKALIRTTCSGV